MGCSLKEIASVTIIWALANASAPSTSPRTSRCRRRCTTVPTTAGATLSARRRARTRPRRAVTSAIRLRIVPPLNAPAAVSGSWTTGTTTAPVIVELMADDLTESLTGLIILSRALGANAFGIFTGLEGYTGDRAAYLSDVALHAMSKGLLGDLMAHCAVLDRRLILLAAASANSSAAEAVRPRVGLATRAMNIARDLSRTPTGANLWQIPLGMFVGLANSVTGNILTEARTSEGRL
jgi:hypothetical protein